MQAHIGVQRLRRVAGEQEEVFLVHREAVADERDQQCRTRLIGAPEGRFHTAFELDDRRIQ
ncbi:hypothetical protein IU470_26865 [Nocardia abscessus]|uniref:Uncharacterized protein n=1 Tax=Nocardia abscessus TaxID=120957 RepID=A0ABS0CED4_9NOCA|nr:hypothetical protein [Nocardia abscessus]MBF6228712.1 hypothetical protein [Nocardia abscessus]